jgi:hypothetical protein
MRLDPNSAPVATSTGGGRASRTLGACAALVVAAALLATAPAGAQQHPAASIASSQAAVPLQSVAPSTLVDAAYRGLLGRAPDDAGLAHWVARLDAGLSPAQLVRELAASDEHATKVVADAYQVFLQRAPDPGGLAWWADHLTTSRSLASLRAELAGSAEYFAVRGGGSNTGFLDALYGDVLGRTPDATGRSYWVGRLEAGEPRRGVARAILNSSEAFLLSDLPVSSVAPRPGSTSWTLDVDLAVDAALIATGTTAIVTVDGREVSGDLVVDGSTIRFRPFDPHPSWVGFGSTAPVIVTVFGHRDGRIERFDHFFTYRAPVAVGSFSTPLVPGQSRNVNIARAAELIDGAVLLSGEQFSLDAAIGQRTPGRGFVANGFISEGETISAVGGGVSQVATTFLNAAWFAGLQLDSFRPHSIYFPRYPMCREATIIWDTLDLVVTNDTPHQLTIGTSVSSTELTISLYGVPWASVESWTGDPYDGDLIGGSFRVDCGRDIEYPDGSTASERYSWGYNAGFPGPES